MSSILPGLDSYAQDLLTYSSFKRLLLEENLVGLLRAPKLPGRSDVLVVYHRLAISCSYTGNDAHGSAHGDWASKGVNVLLLWQSWTRQAVRR